MSCKRKDIPWVHSGADSETLAGYHKLSYEAVVELPSNELLFLTTNRANHTNPCHYAFLFVSFDLFVVNPLKSNAGHP